MTESALPGLPPIPTGGSPAHWRAERLQLVNWGGFEGHHSLDIASGTTLVSGPSGSGKSTILDAYIALMMRSEVAFNGASNDAGAGRARSAEQRNLLSYLRGQTQTRADADGATSAKFLRGQKSATWGAISMTFRNDAGGALTALRIYHVPASATGTKDVLMRLATYDGSFDLRSLEPHANHSFKPQTLRETFTGMWVARDSYNEFAEQLHTKLGIGAGEGGDKALALLARIQAGQQIRTVDELYKTMVLELPPTYTAADLALAHFDDLEAAYVSMRTEEDKATLLEPITGHHHQLSAARTRLTEIDEFGLTAPGNRTPFAIWQAATEYDLLEQACHRVRDDLATNRTALAAARDHKTSVHSELATVRQAHLDAGGGELERLASDLDAARNNLREREDRRSSLIGRIHALDLPLRDVADFNAMQAAAAEFTAGADEAEAALAERRDRLTEERYPLARRRGELRDDRESFAGRAGRIPTHLDTMRRAAAQAAGLSVEGLPFVGELIDIADNQKQWRPAIETVLAGPARILLVHDEKFEHFSRAIDGLQLRGRLNFQATPTGQPSDPESDPDRLAAKLLYKYESPYVGWLTRWLREASRNPVCVETAGELSEHRNAVTLAGQTRRGRSGSHGRADSANAIGFSNAGAIADIDAELETIVHDMRRLDLVHNELRAAEEAFKTRRLAFEVVHVQTYRDIDVDDVIERIERIQQTRERLLTTDSTLRDLESRVEDLEKLDEDALVKLKDLERTKADLEARHVRFVDTQDVVSNVLDRATDGASDPLPANLRAKLDNEFAAAATRDPSDVDHFKANVDTLLTRLTQAARSAQQDYDTAVRLLEGTFDQYQVRWPDPNLGSTIGSYNDYADILARIHAAGLHERHEEWRRRLLAWSGEDLVPLNSTMERAVREIEDRLEPINAILAQLPFGTDNHRLRITLRRLVPHHVKTFRARLRKLATETTSDLTETQLRTRFHELQEFMALMRERSDPRATADSDRDRLLDVRRHLEITADEYTADGLYADRSYAGLGSSSGGESQELVAFIVGAALRFRLGDEDRDRPRFAPVFLDEAFIKADSQFTGRAVRAWQGLGFQLIIGAPQEKFSGLEPHVDLIHAVHKDGNYSVVRTVRDKCATAGTVT